MNRPTRILRAICAGRCRDRGEIPCWQLAEREGVPFPPPLCVEPACAALAAAVEAALEQC